MLQIIAEHLDPRMSRLMCTSGRLNVLTVQNPILGNINGIDETCSMTVHSYINVDVHIAESDPIGFGQLVRDHMSTANQSHKDVFHRWASLAGPLP